MSAPANRLTPIALIQSECGTDPASNRQETYARIEEAANSGSKIVCLQELFATKYLCQEEDHAQFQFAETIPGETTRTLGHLAKSHEVVIIASLFEQRAAGVYHNTAVVIDADGSLIGKYRKMHIPDDPGYYEKFYFTPGDLGFRVFETRFAKIGVCICWDQWFPEAARLTALLGAELIVYPTAIGWLSEDKTTYGESQTSAWKTMLRSHAIANGVFVAAPNRVGTEGNIEFWGNSLLVDPYGETIATGSSDQAQIIQGDADFSLIDVARTHWPFLRDRRIDAYQGLDQRLLDQADK